MSHCSAGIVSVGAGGFGREAISLALDLSRTGAESIDGVVDDAPDQANPQRLERMDAQISVGRGTLLGANATILQPLSVGANATIGANPS